MPPYIAIDKSKNRYFWIAGLDEPTELPAHSGYTTSKEEALNAATAALGMESSQVRLLQSCEASRWRGILKCKWCNSTNLVVTPGKGRLKAGLKCNDCERLSKWLNEHQTSLFEKLRLTAS